LPIDYTNGSKFNLLEAKRWGFENHL
jgi:hypothetical protein